MYRDVYNIFFNDFVFCVREMEITIQKNLMKLLEIFLISIPFLIYIQHIRTVHAVWILNIQQWVQSAQSRREQSTSQTPRFHAGDGDGFATDGWSRTDICTYKNTARPNASFKPSEAAEMDGRTTIPSDIIWWKIG